MWTKYRRQCTLADGLQSSGLMQSYYYENPSEIRNVSVTAAAALSRDAYAMSHLFAVKLGLHTAAGRAWW